VDANIAQYGTLASDPTTGLTTSTVGGSTGYVAPSQSSAAWANFAATLAKGGMTLAEISTIQPGTVVSANGAIMRQATGYPVGGNPFGSLSTSLASAPSWLPWAAGGLAALLLIGGMMGGKR
jgi:hypothetical protein